jgi:outer membrane protein assembly factor BamB
MRNHHMTCVLKDNFIYGFDDGRSELKCIDLRAAGEKWAANKLAKGCLILAEGHLIILTQDGTLALVEATPEEFRLKGTLPGVLSGSDCWALPALASGRLYVRDQANVVCFQVTQ